MILLVGAVKITRRKWKKFYCAEVECNGRRRLLYRRLETKTRGLKYGQEVVKRYKHLEDYARLKELTAKDNGAA